MKPLFIPLKTEYFNAFKDGTKTHEFRIGERWNADKCVIGREVILSKGYGKHERLNGVITSFEVVKVDDLDSGVACAVRKIYLYKLREIWGYHLEEHMINKIGIRLL